MRFISIFIIFMFLAGQGAVTLSHSLKDKDMAFLLETFNNNNFPEEEFGKGELIFNRRLMEKCTDYTSPKSNPLIRNVCFQLLSAMDRSLALAFDRWKEYQRFDLVVKQHSIQNSLQRVKTLFDDGKFESLSFPAAVWNKLNADIEFIQNPNLYYKSIKGKCEKHLKSFYPVKAEDNAAGFQACETFLNAVNAESGYLYNYDVDQLLSYNRKKKIYNISINLKELNKKLSKEMV